MGENFGVALQEAIRRAEAAEQHRLKAEREAAEKRRQRLEAGFAQARLSHNLLSIAALCMRSAGTRGGC